MLFGLRGRIETIRRDGDSVPSCVNPWCGADQEGVRKRAVHFVTQLELAATRHGYEIEGFEVPNPVITKIVAGMEILDISNFFYVGFTVTVPSEKGPITYKIAINPDDVYFVRPNGDEGYLNRKGERAANLINLISTFVPTDSRAFKANQVDETL
jgi:hypothetical protein